MQRVQTFKIYMIRQAKNDKILKAMKTRFRPAGISFPPYVAPMAFPTCELKFIKVLYFLVSEAFQPNFAAKMGVVWFAPPVVQATHMPFTAIELIYSIKNAQLISYVLITFLLSSGKSSSISRGYF